MKPARRKPSGNPIETLPRYRATIFTIMGKQSASMIRLRSRVRLFAVAAIGVAILVAFGSNVPVLAKQTPVASDNPLSKLQTVAEATKYEGTSTESEVQQFLKQLAQAAPQARLDSIGVTNEGRPMHAMIIGKPQAGEKRIDLPLAKDDPRVTVIVLGNIHSGECDGKEALLAMMRDILLEMPKAWEEKLVLVFVPNFNADGNERIGLAHRPGQIGPSLGMGLRENAQNLDLNRDFIKLQTPEVRGLVRAIDQWRADVLIDCHTTNGSLHRYPLTYDVPHNPACHGPMLNWLREEYLPEITRRLDQVGLNSFYYGNFDAEHKKWETYGHEPRYSTEYMGMRGRIGILSESYSYATYEERVVASYRFVKSCLDLLAEKSQKVRSLVAEADARLVNVQAKPKVALTAELFAKEESVPVKGYAFRETESSEKATRKFPSPADKGRIAELVPTDYSLKVWNQFRPKLETEAASAYLLSPQLSWAIERLMMHGIQVDYLADAQALAPASLQQWKVQQVISQPFQGLALTKLEVESTTPSQPLHGGYYVISTAQPLGMLASYLLEPQSEENVATWGFLDGFLIEGESYPIVKVLGQVELKGLTKLQEPPKSERLSLEALYKPGATIGLANPATQEPFWLKDSASYLVERGGSWTVVDAATGSAKAWETGRALMDSLASLEAFKNPVDRRAAVKLDAFNADFSKALIDWKQDLYLFDAATKKTIPLTTTPDAVESLAELSPDGSHVAFVRENNLYVLNCQDQSLRQLTTDGGPERLNGILDWVYQEEVYGRGKFKAFWWSPDGQRLAFLQLDESPVARYQVTDSIGFRQNLEETRYPISGAPNPEAKLLLGNVMDGKLIEADLSSYPGHDRLLCRVDWHPDSQSVCVQIQNRIQSWLDLVAFDAASGSSNRLFREEGPAWIDIAGSPRWLPGGDFLWLSDLPGGRRHLFRVRADGKQRTALTAGHWDVSELLSTSADGKSAWVLANPGNPYEVHLVKAATDAANWQQVSKEAGTHRVRVHASGNFYADTFSSLTQPPKISIHDSQGKLLRSIGVPTIDRFRSLDIRTPDFFTIKASDGQALQSMLLSPAQVDLQRPDRKYPVIIHVYGGPGHPTVKQAWQSQNYWWHQYLTQQGFFVLLCDNRSALGKGNSDSWKIYKNLGQQELSDLDAAVAWVKQQPWADADRLGLWGWSYGGYLTAYAMTHSNHFRAGIAGAPVTDWRNYDSIYTERYMSTPEANPSGYVASSVVEAASQLHGRLLLIHGEMDENVHLSNTLQLANALQKAALPFDLMVYPENRHGIVDPNQKYHLQRMMTDFFQRELRIDTNRDSGRDK